MEINLYESTKAKTFEVLSTPDIKLLEHMGLREGVQVTVQNRYGLGGPILLRVEDSYTIALGKDLAKLVSVKEIETK